MSSRSNAWRLVAVTAALVVTGAAVGALVWSLPPRDNSIQPVRRFTVDRPLLCDGQELLCPLTERQSSRLPGRSERGSQLYLRALDQFEVLALPGTEDAASPRSLRMVSGSSS